MPDEVAGSDTLQTAAEPVQPATDALDTAAESEETQDTQGSDDARTDEPKTFTQEEVNRLNKNVKERERRRANQKIAEALAQAEAYRKVLEGRGEAPKAQQPEPFGKPQRDNYPDYDTWRDALTEWTAEQATERKFSERETKTAKEAEAARQRELSIQFAEREDAVRDRIEDYDEVIATVTGQVPKPVIDYIAESEAGPEVLYALASDPDLLKKVSGLSAVGAARALAQLELKLAQPKPKATSKAPAPPQPIAARSNSPDDGPSSRDSDAEWLRKREAQLRAQRTR